MPAGEVPPAQREGERLCLHDESRQEIVNISAIKTEVTKQSLINVPPTNQLPFNLIFLPQQYNQFFN